MLPDAFWDEEHRRLLALLGPFVEGAVMAGAAAAARSLGGIGLDYALANREASAWARQYTDALLDQLGATSERLVGEALADWIERPGATMGDLVGLLTPRFAGNQARADLIAVTEVTRAYANGQKAAFQAAGVRRWRWNTNHDELVCPVCQPLNGRVVEIGQSFGEFRGQVFTEPPSHPGCRCWVSPVVGKRDSQDRSLAGRWDEFQQDASRQASEALERELRRQIEDAAKERADNRRAKIAAKKKPRTQAPQVAYKPSMTQKEADLWAANSAHKTPVFHRTDTENVRAIQKEGFSLRKTRFGRIWGNGVYMTDDPVARKKYAQWIGSSSKELELRINVRNVFVFDSDMLDKKNYPMFQRFEVIASTIPGGQERYNQLVKELFDEAEAISRLLQENGYDALLITQRRFSEIVGGTQILVFDPKNVTVVK